MNLKSLFTGVILLVVCVTGCAPREAPLPPRFPISGTVSYAGKPLASGTIYFKNDARGDFESLPITDGKYAGNAPAGECRVEIVSIKSKEVEFGGMKSIQETNELPDKYGSHSKLQAEVRAADENILNFDLEK